MGEAKKYILHLLKVNFEDSGKKMLKADVTACSFENWFVNFAHLTIKSKLIKIKDDAFLSYLIGEGESTIRLPSSSSAAGADGKAQSSEKDGSSSDDDDWDEEDADADSRLAPSFPEMEKEIRAAIKLLGGDVFPKLNWSAPRDAAWISCDKTLKCRSVDDVLLLFKSSDFALRDLTQPFLHCEDADEVDEKPELSFIVLRQWRSDIIPNSEFRCFIKSSVLVGICQRHDDAFFPYIAANETQIQRDIQTFYERNVKGKFHRLNFVMDVFRKSSGDVLLIDFGPWGRVTDALMFNWTELNSISAEDVTTNSSDSSSPSTTSTNSWPLFRFVLSDADMRPTRFASSAVPLDFNHLSTGEDPQKLFDFLNLRKLQNGDLDSEDEDDD